MASRKLTDARIKGNGIEVELEISENGWPPEIDEVRRRILSFECIIPPKQIAKKYLPVDLLNVQLRKIPGAKEDKWFTGEAGPNTDSCYVGVDAIRRHVKNLEAAYRLATYAKDWKVKGGMSESRLEERLADNVFEDWKRLSDHSNYLWTADGSFPPRQLCTR
ncbi:hypothetical protein ASPSYDRAFT_530652 [Aspergillus sydowii CBS 593.65]|uniref:Uncharacterized protein n=1 Tax=Aspergillus sydowii CBS 593.65 TaxID=1036612 RepID=A0A1L9T1W9_9EURO|nr:uncharacterized protein ASPSYDRAFT_530652 [Aspergillus sydowii CBS 593.65]OJJ53454.1 hypothetical protein ASPSYDRAFT_530652 [Aspergillus sydowii CBS 593.65]